MTLKEVRISKNLTQSQAAKLCSVSLRSYSTFENDPSKEISLKYKYMLAELNRYGFVDETHGILSMEKIKAVCENVFAEYSIDFSYLFGSYAKGRPREDSDIDLLVSTELTGMKFYGLAEKLRSQLNKKVDLLDLHQLENNPELLKEILKTGVKVYG